MTSQMQRTACFGVGLLWATLSAAPAIADDTELFIGTSVAAGARPNILLIVDNSISMDTNVRTQGTFDGNTPYAAGASGCDAAKVYWRVGSATVPNCSTDRWFYLSALTCKRALQDFITVGTYTGRLGQWNNSSTARRWEALSTSRRTASVECAADEGVHGSTDADTNKWARNGGVSSNGRWGTTGDTNLITGNAWLSSPPFDTQSVTLWSGNYMNWTYGPTFNRPRLEVVKEVANDLLDSVNGVNVGLMTFNDLVNGGSQGGYVMHKIEDITASRGPLQTAINSLSSDAATPLSETLYEAALYMSGRAVDYGDPDSVTNSRDAADSSLYDSPMDIACQKNFIVLLTDGEPRTDDDADTNIRNMRDAMNTSLSSLVGATCDAEVYPPGFTPSGGQCLDELAEFLYEGDFSTLPGQQNITTYTVGFTVDLPILADTANRGGGEYYTADDTATLAGSLQQIVTSILASNTTFTAPTVAVNAFNRTQNLSDLFISVFRPTGRMHWPGNLKKFRLNATTNEIVDATGAPAIDPATGFFAAGARDLWSLTADGPDVEAGGAANIVPIPTSRKVYSNISANPVLTHADNRISTDNDTYVTDALLGTGGTGDPNLDQVINFINGVDLPDTDQDNNTTEPRTQLGDPLHSQPVSMVYGPGLREGLIFSATNDGVLHAFDLETGVEEWAFIPREFLDDQMQLYNNDAMAQKHYGIDGDLALQVVADNDEEIEDNEKVYLFFGMRRGGDFYYGLDVSNPDEPRLLWRRDGTQLPGIGQSWSTPVPTRIDVSGATQNTDKLALVIGGGYEADQDGPSASTDGVGNSIYIIDSVNGSLLWHGSKTGTHKNFDTATKSMDYSIPADIRVIDLDGNSFADRMYAADMGGQVWRFDITNGATAPNLIAGGVIAQLGAAPNATPALTDVRRFYYAPDVAIVNSRGYDFIHLGIGSGTRGNPLSTQAQDRFYALRDYGFARKDQAAFNSLPIITDASLVTVDTASESVPQGTSNGWKLPLSGSGEKVLAEARTFNNEVIFTTFRPGAAATGCTPQVGTNRLYRMSVFNAAPVLNLDGSADPTTLTMSDLYVEKAGAPLPSPQLVFLPRDRDRDGIPDPEDDSDSDGIPDSDDPDYDGDNVADTERDTDNDGEPDVADNDIDGDGIPNGSDPDANGNGVVDLPNEDRNNNGQPDFLEVLSMTGTVVMIVGTMKFPVGFRNDPLRTYWRQNNAGN